MIGRAGEQGIAVIASHAAETRLFYLQARPITAHQRLVWERLVNSEPSQAYLSSLFEDENGSPAAVAISMRIPIQFCPHCGADLGKLVRRQQEGFDKLAESHRQYAES